MVVQATINRNLKIPVLLIQTQMFQHLLDQFYLLIQNPMSARS